MNKLKPCPFCGSTGRIFMTTLFNESILASVDELPELKNPYYIIRCRNCFCGTGIYASIGKAAEAWNRRAERFDSDVVHCKDCKHCDKGRYNEQICRYWDVDDYEETIVKDDDFCSHGERRR